MKNNKADLAYKIYVNARTRAWNIYDRLVTTGTFRKTNPKYLKACEIEHKKWIEYLRVVDGVEGGK